MTFTLPTEPTTAAAVAPSPLSARIYIGGPPKTGKTTLVSQWAPKTTLFLDAQHGTDLLPGERYVNHIDGWTGDHGFDDATIAIAAAWKAGTLPFKTVAIDTIDLIYKYADAHAGAKYGQVAAGLADFGKGTSEAEGVFRRAVGRLLACRGLGIIFVGHTDSVDNDGRQQLVPALDKRVRNYVIGEVEHQLIAEKIGNRSVIHTQGSQRFEAGSRLPLPEPLDMDARALYAAMNAGIKQLIGTPDTAPAQQPAPTNGNTAEPVLASVAATSTDQES